MGPDVPATAVTHQRLSLYSRKWLKPLDVCMLTIRDCTPNVLSVCWSNEVPTGTAIINFFSRPRITREPNDSGVVKPGLSGPAVWLPHLKTAEVSIP
jgi:hypothetical protein